MLFDLFVSGDSIQTIDGGKFANTGDKIRSERGKFPAIAAGKRMPFGRGGCRAVPQRSRNSESSPASGSRGRQQSTARTAVRAQGETAAGES